MLSVTSKPVMLPVNILSVPVVSVTSKPIIMNSVVMVNVVVLTAIASHRHLIKTECSWQCRFILVHASSLNTYQFADKIVGFVPQTSKKGINIASDRSGEELGGRWKPPFRWLLRRAGQKGKQNGNVYHCAKMTFVQQCAIIIARLNDSYTRKCDYAPF